MKRILNRFILPISLALTLLLSCVTPVSAGNNPKCDFQLEQQNLWINHVFRTRDFIVSNLASLEDENVVLERLLKNQQEIGDSIKPYYGNEAGDKLAALLTDHIKIAGQVIAAAKSNNKTEFDKYNTAWFKNADAIADYLSSLNPNFSNSKLKEMLYTHLQFVTGQVTARLQKDWKKDIETFDKGEKHMIQFASVIAEGIIKQFPDKFK